MVLAASTCYIHGSSFPHNYDLHSACHQADIELVHITCHILKWLYCMSALLMISKQVQLRLPSLQVDGKQISAIKEGLMCLIGVKAGDTLKDSEYM